MPNESTVFVVDDDRATALSLDALITSFGLTVETYNSAEEFLAVFDGSCNGCLVLDVRLQGMNGLELQAALAADDLEIPIIVISGHADRAITNKALQNGALACFEKPFDGRELCAAVRAALLRR